MNSRLRFRLWHALAAVAVAAVVCWLVLTPAVLAVVLVSVYVTLLACVFSLIMQTGWRMARGLGRPDRITGRKPGLPELFLQLVLVLATTAVALFAVVMLLMLVPFVASIWSS
jgi:hypothetical protein